MVIRVFAFAENYRSARCAARVGFRSYSILFTRQFSQDPRIRFGNLDLGGLDISVERRAATHANQARAAYRRAPLLRAYHPNPGSGGFSQSPGSTSSPT